MSKTIKILTRISDFLNRNVTPENQRMVSAYVSELKSLQENNRNLILDIENKMSELDKKVSVLLDNYSKSENENEKSIIAANRICLDLQKKQLESILKRL